MAKSFRVAFKAKAAYSGEAIDGSVIVTTCAKDPGRRYLEGLAKTKISELDPEARRIRISSIRELGDLGAAGTERMANDNVDRDEEPPGRG